MKPTALIEPYYFPLFVAVGEEELMKLSKKIPTLKASFEGKLETSLGLTIRFNDGCLIYLNEDEGLEEGTIFHEALHATHFLMDSRGIPIALETTEVAAYTQGHIVEIVLKQVDKFIARKVKEKVAQLEALNEEELVAEDVAKGLDTKSGKKKPKRDLKKLNKEAKKPKRGKKI